MQLLKINIQYIYKQTFTLSQKYPLHNDQTINVTTLRGKG